MEARILRAADVFAALVEPRSYKPAMSSGEALQRMQQLAGKLDPVALRALEQVVAAGDIAPELGR